jgi:hypothetical protein
MNTSLGLKILALRQVIVLSGLRGNFLVYILG